jgi:hypothetical protein
VYLAAKNTINGEFAPGLSTHLTANHTAPRWLWPALVEALAAHVDRRVALADSLSLAKSLKSATQSATVYRGHSTRAVFRKKLTVDLHLQENQR